jgi:hypothetical protein
MGLDDVRSKNEWWPFLSASPATFHPTPPRRPALPQPGLRCFYRMTHRINPHRPATG